MFWGDCHCPGPFFSISSIGMHGLGCMVWYSVGAREHAGKRSVIVSYVYQIPKRAKVGMIWGGAMVLVGLIELFYW